MPGLLIGEGGGSKTTIRDLAQRHAPDGPRRAAAGRGRGQLAKLELAGGVVKLQRQLGLLVALLARPAGGPRAIQLQEERALWNTKLVQRRIGHAGVSPFLFLVRV